MRHYLLRTGRTIALALVLAVSLAACKNTLIRPPDQNFFTPNWCLPNGCSWGGGGA